MPVQVVSLGDIPVQELPGRKLQWLVTPQTIGAEKISMAVMDCPAGSTVRPLHSHHNTEEILFILEGEGEAWVDGEVAQFKQGDAVLFPPNSNTWSTIPGTRRCAPVLSSRHQPAPAPTLCTKGRGGSYRINDRQEPDAMYQSSQPGIPAQ